MKVVGFEGRRRASSALNWGAAALGDHEWLVNPTAKLRVPRTDLARLVADGAVTAIPSEIEVAREFVENPLVVVEVNLRDPLADLVRLEIGRPGTAIAREKAGDFDYYVYPNQLAFDRYADQAIAAILTRVLYNQPERGVAERLLELGVILNAQNPQLLAVRSYMLSPDDGYAAEIARSVLPADKLAQFEEVFRACRGAETQYVLKYEGGVAAGGGFDVDVASKTLKAFVTYHDKVAPFLEQRYSFLQRSPPPRFKELRAASAEMTFVPTVEGESLGDRVARYLELLWLEKTIRGELPSAPPDEPKLQQARERIVEACAQISQPTPETQVLQTGLGASEPERVEERPEQPVAEAEVSTTDVRLFAFIWGIEADAARIEARIRSNRLLKPAVDAGSEDWLASREDVLRQKKDLLFRPAILTLRRDARSQFEQFTLLRIQPLEIGQRVTASALPSGVVEGAILTGIRPWFERSGTQVASSLGDFPLPEPTRNAALAWFRIFDEAALVFELARAGRGGSWLATAARRRPSELQRFLLVLDELGGEAEIGQIVLTINMRFAANVRANNTRGVVNDNPSLLEFPDEAPTRARLTALGRAYLRALRSGSGETPQAG